MKVTMGMMVNNATTTGGLTSLYTAEESIISLPDVLIPTSVSNRFPEGAVITKAGAGTMRYKVTTGPWRVVYRPNGECTCVMSGTAIDMRQYGSVRRVEDNGNVIIKISISSTLPVQGLDATRLTSVNVMCHAIGSNLAIAMSDQYVHVNAYGAFTVKALGTPDPDAATNNNVELTDALLDTAMVVIRFDYV